MHKTRHKREGFPTVLRDRYSKCQARITVTMSRWGHSSRTTMDYFNVRQGQFFPFFILTVSAIVTIPLTYSLLKPSSDPGATAPRIHSDFKPEHADLIQIQRKKQRRRERRLKRILAAIAGWALMALMAYLIVVTARTIPKIWNPYDILGISEVCPTIPYGELRS